MKALIFNIQRFSTKDGPGIRTTVFFKGCNVNCAWCHNPESIDGDQVLRFDLRRCTACGRCAEVCRYKAVRMVGGKRVYEIEKCTLCGECALNCPSGALEIVGKYYSVEELFSILIKDEDFYKESGGGITFSGGEPLVQIDFLVEILRKLKNRGIQTAVDTALNVEWGRVERVLSCTDLILLDIKGMDSGRHIKNTGVDNQLIHENAVRLSETGVEIIVRMPLVRGLNDSIDEFTAAANFIKDWRNLAGVELLAYHSLGVDKSVEYDALVQQQQFEPPEMQRLRGAAEIFRNAGIRII